MNMPPCPVCGSMKIAKRPGGRFRCLRCGGLFDTDPNEGGDYGRQPDERIIRQEREKVAKQRGR